MIATAVAALTLWLLIVAGLLRANHLRFLRKPWYETSGLWREPQLPAYPPPVPPSRPRITPAVASADWFWGIPSDCLGDDAVRSLCDDIERREFS